MDPLLHFLLIGAELFLVFGLIKGLAENQENSIVITQGDFESLKANFARTCTNISAMDHSTKPYRRYSGCSISRLGDKLDFLVKRRTATLIRIRFDLGIFLRKNIGRLMA